jgi:Tol biopolymer transport system component
LVDAALAAGGADTPEQRSLRPEDIAGIRWVTTPSLSPDGKQVVYVVVEWDQGQGAKAKRQSTLWLAPADGSKPPRGVPDHPRARAPRWSPDGRSLAFLSPGKDKDGKKQIFIMPADGSSTTCVTDHSEGVSAFQWSPDGKALAFTALPPPIRRSGRITNPSYDVLAGQLQCSARWRLPPGSVTMRA